MYLIGASLSEPNTSELNSGFLHTYMWQSWVETEHYSVAYFNHITAFKALEHRTFVKGGAHMRSEGACIYLISLCSAYEPRP